MTLVPLRSIGKSASVTLYHIGITHYSGKNVTRFIQAYQRLFRVDVTPSTFDKRSYHLSDDHISYAARWGGSVNVTSRHISERNAALGITKRNAVEGNLWKGVSACPVRWSLFRKETLCCCERPTDGHLSKCQYCTTLTKVYWPVGLPRTAVPWVLIHVVSRITLRYETFVIGILITLPSPERGKSLNRKPLSPIHR